MPGSVSGGSGPTRLDGWRREGWGRGGDVSAPSPGFSTPDSRPWRLVSLPPLPYEAVRGLLGDLPVEITVPEIGSAADLRGALADAELVLGDWRTAQPGIDAVAVGNAPH